jgi:hypothetical protein
MWYRPPGLSSDYDPTVPALHAILQAPDWIFWTGGGLLVVPSLIILLLALFRDRAMGRRRCPSCWYDMAGAQSLRCPECGRQPRKERHLLRTRRRWARAALASLTLLLGSAAALWPAARARCPLTLVPTFILIRFTPKVGTETRWDPVASDWITSPIATEIRRRIDADQLSPSHWLTALQTASVLRIRNHWPKDQDFTAGLEIPELTFGKVVLTLNLRSSSHSILHANHARDTFTVTPFHGDQFEHERNHNVGPLPVGTRSLIFEPTIDRVDKFGISRPTLTLDTWHVPITLVDSALEVLPISADSHRTGTLALSSKLYPATPPGVTRWWFSLHYTNANHKADVATTGLAFRVELLHRGTRVEARTVGLEPNPGSDWASPQREPPLVTFGFDSILPEPGSPDLHEWSIHVTPDPTPILAEWHYTDVAPLSITRTLDTIPNDPK